MSEKYTTTIQGTTHTIKIVKIPTCTSCLELLAAEDSIGYIADAVAEDGKIRILTPEIVDTDECSYDHD